MHRLLHRRASLAALRRATGVVVLALFARQSMAMAWMMVPSAASAAPAAMPGMMQHHHAPAAPTAPAAPRHDAGCDGAVPSACCALGSGCIVAATVTSAAFAAPAYAPSARSAPFANAPLWRDISPADPPPRA
ncbi:MAG: hypothetical protein HYR75_07175 [Gemmatimonadetes bacterium]|nr:hypothetical protein [Gemmatimonadota bacterium]MBI3567284.1 hypothetical protein [Gemmatimonadota bacterium]